MADRTPLEQRTEEIHIDASPQEVYDVIADIQRLDERNPDFDWASFTEGYRETAEGARFQVRNQMGPVKWTSDCKVHIARRGEELAWDVLDGEWPVTRWRYQVEPEEHGTRLRASAELLRVPASSKVFWMLQGGQESRMQKLERSLRETLEQTKQEIEAKQPAGAAT